MAAVATLRLVLHNRVGTSLIYDQFIVDSCILELIPPADGFGASVIPFVTCRSDGVTIEWQRQRAKEMRKYFQDKQLEAQVKKSQ